VRLDPAEIAELPLPAALLDGRRELVAATPSWRGLVPGSVVYYAGHGYLAVGAEEAADPDLRTGLTQLLGELEVMVGGLSGPAAVRSRLLASGLRLVAGEPVSEDDRGTSADVLEMAGVGVAARVSPPLAIEALDHRPARAVPAPAVIALALVQFAVNISHHERVDVAGTRRVESIAIRVSDGPTFHVEWPSEAPRSTGVESQRHVQRRRRWGWGYVRMAADALGGTALPPAPAGPDREAVSFGLGSRNLTMPLALFEGGRLTRSTRAWDQEHHAGRDEARARQQAVPGELARMAGGRPGTIVHDAFHVARAVPGTDRVWMALPPETGADRVLDVLKGLDHERLLLTAAEPHATRLHALNVVLRHGLGEPLATCYRSDWQARFPRACRALGVESVELGDAPVYPDPQLSALLLAELGGTLRVDGEGAVWFDPRRRIDDARLRLLGADQKGRVRLTEGMAF
jgi:hypothetical protein